MHSRPRGDVRGGGLVCVRISSWSTRPWGLRTRGHAMTLHLHGRIAGRASASNVQTVLPVSRSCKELEGELLKGVFEHRFFLKFHSVRVIEYFYGFWEKNFSNSPSYPNDEIIGERLIKYRRSNLSQIFVTSCCIFMDSSKLDSFRAGHK